MILYENLFKKLAENKIAYLVAGGFAVNFHQVQRATADLDLILHMESANIEKFLKLVRVLGYQPQLPVQLTSLNSSSKLVETKTCSMLSN